MEEDNRAEPGLEPQGMTAETAQLMGKALTALFWLRICAIPTGLMTLPQWSQWIPQLRQLGMVVNYACLITTSSVYIRLDNRFYRLAGWLDLAGIIASVWLRSFDRGGWLLVYYVLIFSETLISFYFRTRGHAQILRNTDAGLAGKWKRLGRGLLGTMAVLALGIGLLFVSKLVGSLVCLAAMIGVIVVVMMELVYLYKTARILRRPEKWEMQ